MNRYAVLSEDGKTVENIIIASHEYAKDTGMLCCDDLEIQIGWVMDTNGEFIDPNPLSDEIAITEYAEIDMLDDDILQLLESLKDNES